MRTTNYTIRWNAAKSAGYGRDTITRTSKCRRFTITMTLVTGGRDYTVKDHEKDEVKANIESYEEARDYAEKLKDPNWISCVH